MTYDQINTFLTVVKLHSITHAAEYLFISQSTASHRIHMLEEELGLQLLIRRKGHKEVKLTPAGEAFLPLAYRCRSTLGEVKVLTDQANQHKYLSVSAHDSLNCFLFNTIFPAFLQEMMDDSNDIILRWESHNTERSVELLESGYLDVAYLRNPVRSRNMLMKPVFSEEFLIITPPDSIYDEEYISPKKLDPVNEIFMSFTWGNDFARWHDSVFANRGIVHCYCNALFALNELMFSPKSWVIVPASVAMGMVRRHGCHILHFAETKPPQVVTFQTIFKGKGEQHLEVDALNEKIRTSLIGCPFITLAT